MLKNKANNEFLMNVSVSNVDKNLFQYYIPILIFLISVIIIDIFIYRFLLNSKEEKETAFIEGSEVAVKSLIAKDLELISNQYANLDQLSILKNHSYAIQTNENYNTIGSILYVKQNKNLIAFDLQPLVFLVNSILAQNFYYQVSFNNHILANNIGGDLFDYIRKYQINEQSFFAIKLTLKVESIFLQKNLQQFKDHVFSMLVASIALFLLGTVLITYIVSRQKRRSTLCNARIAVEEARELNLHYIKSCQDLDSNDFLPISLPVFNEHFSQIKVADIIKEIKTCVLAYTTSFHYKFKLQLMSEISSINIKYDATLFKQIIFSLLYNVLYFMRGGDHIKHFSIAFQSDSVVVFYDSFAANEEHMCNWSRGLFQHLGNPYILDCKKLFQLIKDCDLRYEVTPQQGKNKVIIFLNQNEEMGRVLEFKKNK